MKPNKRIMFSLFPFGLYRKQAPSATKPFRFLTKPYSVCCKAMSEVANTPLHLLHNLARPCRTPFASGAKPCGQPATPFRQHCKALATGAGTIPFPFLPDGRTEG